jgi:hypothetical protein
MPAREDFWKKFLTSEGPRLKDGSADPEYQEQMKKTFGFGYRNGVGELIYAMVTCRPDISTSTVRCAQNSACPHEVHYAGVKHILKYLWCTRKDGIYFWRVKPLMDLPDHTLPEVDTTLHGSEGPKAKRPQHGALDPYSFVDSDWAACLRTRRSMSGVGAKMAGGPIAYKTKLQPTVAMSSTEAEFMAACDAAKMMLFIRTILWELGIPQHAATVIYEDNDGATAMANAQKPTSRTRHMDIRFFALSEWVERDLVILERIHTSVNEADHLTKVLDRTLFYRHVDHLMGHVPPLYSPCYGRVTGKEQVAIPEDVTDEPFAKPHTLVPVAAKTLTGSYTWDYIVASTTIFQSTSDFFHPDFNQYWIVGGC